MLAGRTHEGSGIGLALVQEIRLPFGSAHLPADRVAPRETVASAARAYVEEALRWTPALGPAAAPAGETCVLVADDNADMRDYLARLLGEHWDVERGRRRRRGARARARAAGPTSCVTDVMMPRSTASASCTRSAPIATLARRPGRHGLGARRRGGALDGLQRRRRRLPGQAVLRARAGRPRRDAARCARLRATRADAARRAREPVRRRRPVRSRSCAGPEPSTSWPTRLSRGRRPARRRRQAVPRGAARAGGQGFDELLDGVYRAAASRTSGARRCARSRRAAGRRAGRALLHFVYAPMRDDGAAMA